LVSTEGWFGRLSVKSFCPTAAFELGLVLLVKSFSSTELVGHWMLDAVGCTGCSVLGLMVTSSIFVAFGHTAPLTDAP
jgi:hypothetical protein